MPAAGGVFFLIMLARVLGALRYRCFRESLADESLAEESLAGESLAGFSLAEESLAEESTGTYPHLTLPSHWVEMPSVFSIAETAS